METGENKLSVVREVPQQSFQIVPPNFSQELASVCLLCFQISENKLHFALINKSKARYEGIGSYRFKEEHITPIVLKTFLSEEPLFKNDFAQVIYTERNRNFSLIPSAFYLPEKHNEYLKQSSFFDEKLTNAYHQNKTFEVQNSYQLNEELKKTVTNFFAKGRAFHHIDILLEVMAMLQNMESKQLVLVNIEGSFFDLIIADGKKLKLSNSYYFEGEEDFLYYALLACDQLGLNTTNVEVLLMGQNSQNEKLTKLINAYFGNWKVFEESPFLTSSKQITPHHLSNYFVVLNSFLCA